MHKSEEKRKRTSHAYFLHLNEPKRRLTKPTGTNLSKDFQYSVENILFN